MTTDALLNHSDCLVATSAFGTKQTLKTTASDAALAAWRRQMTLHVSVESNGAESPA